MEPQCMEPSANFSHRPVLLSSLPGIYQSECHVDVTFVCENGIKVKSHKLLLGSVSPFLHYIFRSQSPREMIEILLPEVKADDLDNLLRYTYEGLIRLDQYEVKEFKKLKKMLQINIPTIISEIPENENECDMEDEELNDLYPVSETTLVDLSINATPCSCQGFKQVLAEEKSLAAHGKKRLNPFNRSFNNNIKKIKLDSSEQSSVPQDLNCLLQSFSSNQGTVEPVACTNDKEVKDTHSVQGSAPPRPIPLELYRDLVHKVLRKKSLEEAKLFIKEELARRLEEEVEKKLAERLAKEGKLILIKDLRTLPQMEKQNLKLDNKLQHRPMWLAQGVMKPNSKCQDTESQETTIPTAIKEKQTNKPVTEEEYKIIEDNGQESIAIPEKRSVIVRQISGEEKMAKDASDVQKLPTNLSKDKEVQVNRGNEREKSRSFVSSTREGGVEKSEKERRMEREIRPKPHGPHKLFNVVASSQSSGGQSSNISHVPMPKSVGIKVIGPEANTSHPGKTIAVTSDGKVLILKKVTESNEEKYFLASKPIHDGVSVALSTSQSPQQSRTTTTQAIMTAEEKAKATRKEQERSDS